MNETVFGDQEPEKNHEKQNHHHIYIYSLLEKKREMKKDTPQSRRGAHMQMSTAEDTNANEKAPGFSNRVLSTQSRTYSVPYTTRFTCTREEALTYAHKTPFDGARGAAFTRRRRCRRRRGCSWPWVAAPAPAGPTRAPPRPPAPPATGSAGAPAAAAAAPQPPTRGRGIEAPAAATAGSAPGPRWARRRRCVDP
jgi:hypothetical protein